MAKYCEKCAKYIGDRTLYCLIRAEYRAYNGDAVKYLERRELNRDGNCSRYRPLSPWMRLANWLHSKFRKGKK
jgi:hypothetical protein